MWKWEVFGCNYKSTNVWQWGCEKYCSKVSKTADIFYKIKLCVPEHVLMNLYCIFAYPYSIYCIVIWGRTYDRHCSRCHQLRLITGHSYLALTNPLFHRTIILKVTDLHTMLGQILTMCDITMAEEIGIALSLAFRDQQPRSDPRDFIYLMSGIVCHWILSWVIRMVRLRQNVKRYLTDQYSDRQPRVPPLNPNGFCECTYVFVVYCKASHVAIKYNCISKWQVVCMCVYIGVRVLYDWAVWLPEKHQLVLT